MIHIPRESGVRRRRTTSAHCNVSVLETSPAGQSGVVRKCLVTFRTLEGNVMDFGSSVVPASTGPKDERQYTFNKVKSISSLIESAAPATCYQCYREVKRVGHLGRACDIQ